MKTKYFLENLMESPEESNTKKSTLELGEARGTLASKNCESREKYSTSISSVESLDVEEWEAPFNQQMGPEIQKKYKINIFEKKIRKKSSFNFEIKDFDHFFNDDLRGENSIVCEKEIEIEKKCNQNKIDSSAEVYKNFENNDRNLKKKWNKKMIKFCESLAFSKKNKRQIKSRQVGQILTSSRSEGQMSTKSKNRSTKIKLKAGISKRRERFPRKKKRSEVLARRLAK